MPAEPVELPSDETLTALVDRLALEEKVALISGGSAWGTSGLPSIGLRDMVLSDGPSGVRGILWDERDPSLSLPSATALSASWDVDLAREYGAVIAAQARIKGVDVVLGPTVNLHRSPLGGRHFEAFSEDPLLTADLAAAYVVGVQENGVGAAIKHYVANDFETDRFNADVQLGERALRELYLLAFERAVVEAKAWLVMSAYNSINGVTATENELLTDPLTTTWGFDGVVVSDWTAVRSIESARHPQDLAMPGPSEAWGERLVEAVRQGAVDESLIDRKVLRILRLAARVGALDGFEPKPITHGIDAVAFARRAETEGMVLVHNDGILPLAPESLSRIAVIGDHADHARIQGGGSATVMPENPVGPLAGLRAALPESVVIDYRVGALTQQGFVEFDPSRMTNPVTGGAGARLTHRAADGTELGFDDRLASLILDFGTEDFAPERAYISFDTHYTPAVTEELRIGFASPGAGKLFVDDVLVLEETVVEETDAVQAFFAPSAASVPVPVRAGEPVALRFEFVPGAIVDGVLHSLSVTFGTEISDRTEQQDAELIREAVDAARDADVAIVVVGTNSQTESEGVDRADLRLPGLQDALVAAVAAVNPRTIVAVNAGAPVEMPWSSDVAAILLTWFGGQEYGHALADVLLGVSEPGGRLPTTWPERLEDAPVSDVTPIDGVVRYDEGIHIGYRAWQRSSVPPAYAFGHGLGYTSWQLGALEVDGSQSSVLEATIDVSNTGSRAGKQIVQLYARRADSTVERPAIWLVGFGVARAEAGEGVTVRLTVPLRTLAHWSDGWVLEPGEYEFLVGTSLDDLSDPVVVRIPEGAGF